MSRQERRDLRHVSCRFSAQIISLCAFFSSKLETMRRQIEMWFKQRTAGALAALVEAIDFCQCHLAHVLVRKVIDDITLSVFVVRVHAHFVLALRVLAPLLIWAFKQSLTVISTRAFFALPVRLRSSCKRGRQQLWFCIALMRRKPRRRLLQLDIWYVCTCALALRATHDVIVQRVAHDQFEALDGTDSRGRVHTGQSYLPVKSLHCSVRHVL
mmetsp:Transcript_4271/g.7155  ORF Transcript_4271/g.7155 Transcript_4271/m.7155 type:complete len:213 (+) Transcript_4271:716-1354(+)